jgi:glutamine synthetase
MDQVIAKKWEKIKKLCHVKHIEMIDFKVQDMHGRLHHVTIPVENFTDEILTEGITFNSSSLGFNVSYDYELIQIPDLDTVFLDSFRDKPTLSFFVDLYVANEEKTRAPQDVRYIAQKTQDYLKKTGIADQAMFRTEMEFYIFKDVKYDARRSRSFYYLESEEKFHSGAYHAVNPMDMYDDFRDSAVAIMKDFGIRTKYHHHEIGKKAQQEIEFLFESLLTTADHTVIAKYLLFNLAERNNIFLTFMPKPMFNAPGSGWHLHSFLSKENQNIFLEGKNGLSKTGHHFIAGILKHMKSLCAITNPSTNSYKRLVPGTEAPTDVCFGKNMSDAIRLPNYFENSSNQKCVEFRTPDLTTNPYFALSATVLAGVDGIENELNIDDFNNECKVPLPRYLDDALDHLEDDHEFLLKGDVFNKEILNFWISQKRDEIHSIATRPHPFEFKLYFSY